MSKNIDRLKGKMTPLGKIEFTEREFRMIRFKAFHWFKMFDKDKSAEMTRIDSSTGQSETLTIHWMCICNKCHLAGMADSLEFKGSHAAWIGEPPNIEVIH